MEDIVQTTEAPTFEKVWLMYQETDRKFQETDKKFRETDRQFKETKEILAKSSLELDKKIEETNKQLNKMLKKMGESELRWSKFIESLVDGAVIKLLTSRGINVVGSSMREKVLYNGKQYEIDIIAKNGIELVAVEVKTTLGTTDVKEFLEKLNHFKRAFPIYANMTLYGAVAYISVESDADIFAERKGLFVIKATGESAKITNVKNFKPKVW